MEEHQRELLRGDNGENMFGPTCELYNKLTGEVIN